MPVYTKVMVNYMLTTIKENANEVWSMSRNAWEQTRCGERSVTFPLTRQPAPSAIMFACGHLCVRDLSSCEHERPQLTVRSRQPGGHLDAPRSPAGCRRGLHAGGPGVYGDRRTGTSATPNTLVTGMLPATPGHPLQAQPTNLVTQPRSETPI